MKSRKQRTSKTQKNPSSGGSTRRTFLKQSFAFAALTSTYSVVSLTQLACSDGNTTLNGGYFNGNHFEYAYMENDYFDNDYFDPGYFDNGNFFYY